MFVNGFILYVRARMCARATGLSHAFRDKQKSCFAFKITTKFTVKSLKYPRQIIKVFFTSVRGLLVLCMYVFGAAMQAGGQWKLIPQELSTQMGAQEGARQEWWRSSCPSRRWRMCCAEALDKPPSHEPGLRIRCCPHLTQSFSGCSVIIKWQLE